MDSNTYLIVGGSSGIGLELVKLLDEQQHTVYIGSRRVPDLTQYNHVHHLSYDASADHSELVGLPDVLNSLVYCPGSINLKPLQRLSTDDFSSDFNHMCSFVDAWFMDYRAGNSCGWGYGVIENF